MPLSIFSQPQFPFTHLTYVRNGGEPLSVRREARPGTSGSLCQSEGCEAACTMDGFDARQRFQRMMERFSIMQVLA